MTENDRIAALERKVAAQEQAILSILNLSLKAASLSMTTDQEGRNKIIDRIRELTFEAVKALGEDLDLG